MNYATPAQLAKFAHQFEQPPEPTFEEERDEWIADRATELWVSPRDTRDILEDEGLRLSEAETVRLVAERLRLMRQRNADDTSADQCLRDLIDALDPFFIAAAAREFAAAQEFGDDHDD